MNELIRPMPRPPAHVAPYVEALGADLAVIFLLTYGGAEISLSDSPKRAAHAALVGPDHATALAGMVDRLRKRVPLANPWLAKMLAWQGQSNGEIARRLRTTDITVRGYLKDDRVR